MLTNIIKTAAVLLFFTAWAILCIMKYNKWRRRRKNCTKELLVKVIEVKQKKTARGGMVYKPIFKTVDDEEQLLPEGASVVQAKVVVQKIDQPWHCENN